MTNDDNTTHAGSMETVAALPPLLNLDAQRYLGHLDAFDLSDAEKVELLQTLWTILRAFVDLGFNADACGQLLKSIGFNETGDIDALNSSGETGSTEMPGDKTP